jgi:hypothetical protein
LITTYTPLAQLCSDSSVVCAQWFTLVLLSSRNATHMPRLLAEVDSLFDASNRFVGTFEGLAKVSFRLRNSQCGIFFLLFSFFGFGFSDSIRLGFPPFEMLAE